MVAGGSAWPGRRMHLCFLLCFDSRAKVSFGSFFRSLLLDRRARVPAFRVEKEALSVALLFLSGFRTTSSRCRSFPFLHHSENNLGVRLEVSSALQEMGLEFRVSIGKCHALETEFRRLRVEPRSHLESLQGLCTCSGQSLDHEMRSGWPARTHPLSEANEEFLLLVADTAVHNPTFSRK